MTDITSKFRVSHLTGIDTGVLYRYRATKESDMESFATIGNMYAKSTLHKVAHSALPDAPVQPYVEPRRRLRRLTGTIPHPVVRLARRPVIEVRTAGYGHPC